MPISPITLADHQVVEVETLAALLNQEQIADYFGISRRTFQNILARDEEVRARYKRGKAKAIAHVANGLLQKARAGHTASMIFYLKTQAGWREEPPQLTAAVVHADATGALEKLRAKLAELSARQGRVSPSPGGEPRVALEGVGRAGDCSMVEKAS